MDQRIDFIKKYANDLTYQEAMKVIGLIVECDETQFINDNKDGSRIDLKKLSPNTITKIYHLIKYKIHNKTDEMEAKTRNV